MSAAPDSGTTDAPRGVVLVTGASRGIGRALCEHYALAGRPVCGCSRRESDWVHPGYRHFVLDLRDEDAVVSMFGAIAAELGGLEALVNCAGVAALGHTLLARADEARSLFDTNVVAPLVLTREAARLMKKKRFGRIVHFTTIAVPLRIEGEALYAASKAAVETMTRITARELARFCITVNAVGPSIVRTEMGSALPADLVAATLAKQAIPRVGELRDVVNVVDFFLRRESDAVTGQVLYLGGV